MPHAWTDPQPHAFREAYLDWARLIGMRRDMHPPERLDRGPEYAPVFVRLRTGEEAVQARAALLQLAQDATEPFLMDYAELAVLRARAGAGGEDPMAGLPDEYMLYWRVGTLAEPYAHLFDVIDTGMPVQMAQASGLPAPASPVPPSSRSGTPIVAIIDDGLGFLNARFTRTIEDGTRQSRFHALWLQSLTQRSDRPAGSVAGRILTRDAIDEMIALGDERACYAELNAALYPGRTRDETGFATTHGTHVLDLAAGADPEAAADPARNWPLLGVQLPPETIGDTSGTWFESYLVMGLRWILRQARQVDRTAPVIVNVSLGVLAGPKDGTRFAEYQMSREARLWEEVTGQPVRLVWAFGNSYRSSQVAEFAFDGKAGPPQDVTWRAQPDDETASYLEVHCRGAGSETMQVGLTAPDGTASGRIAMQPGTIRTLERPDGAALARIYHVPASALDGQTTSPAHYVVALAPTRGQKAGEPEAACGAWTVTVSCEAAARVYLQVQRDDAIRGAEARGRQSYLDHAAAYDWDAGRAAYARPHETGPITDAGCHNALVTADTRQIFCVGAAKLSPRTPENDSQNYHAAPYSGEGAPWSVPGPTVATVVGTGAFYGGLRAAGTLSGSTRRQGGTSAAAGRLTRALALCAPRIVANSGMSGTRKLADLHPRLLIESGEQDARLGEAIVVLPEDLPGC